MKATFSDTTALDSSENQQWKTSSSLTFFSQRSPHNILPHIILLSQVEELADLASPLGTKTTRDGAVGQTGNILLT